MLVSGLHFKTPKRLDRPTNLFAYLEYIHKVGRSGTPTWGRHAADPFANIHPISKDRTGTGYSPSQGLQNPKTTAIHD